MSAQRILERLQSEDSTERLDVCDGVDGVPLNAANWTGEEIEAMTQAARTNKSVKSIFIYVARLTLATCKPFETLLECSSDASELTLATRDLEHRRTEDQKIVSVLFTAASKNPKSNVSKVRLSLWPGTSPQSVAPMCVYICGLLSNLPRLKEVHLSWCIDCPCIHLTEEDARTVGQLLSRLESLETLRMKVSGPGESLLLSELKRFSCLNELGIRAREEGVLQEALRLPSTHPSLQSITITGEGNDTVTSFPTLPHASKLKILLLSDLSLAPSLSSNSTLIQLELFRCRFVDQDVSPIFAGLSGLKFLDLKESILPDRAVSFPASLKSILLEGCDGIGHHLFTSIRSLPNLEYFLIKSCQGEALTEMQNWDFLSAFPQLETFELSAPPNITDVVRNAPESLVLDLGNDFQLTQAWISQLLEALRASRVRSLHFTGGGVGVLFPLESDLAVAISTGELPLEEFRSLLPCSEDDLPGFFTGLRANTTLEALELNATVSKAGNAEAILAALKDDPGNDTIDELAGVKFVPDLAMCGKEIMHLVSFNEYGRWLLRAFENSVPLGLWPQILYRASRDDQTSVLYHFLKSKSDLVRPKPSGRKRQAPTEE